MTEFSPPDALITQNEQATTEMRINAWSHREHIKPIMKHMFAAAAKHAMAIRSEMIEDIETTDINRFYHEYAVLQDGREITLSSLLHFPLHTQFLPVDQAGIPDGQQLKREYTVALRIGGESLGFSADDDLKLSSWYRHDEGSLVGEDAFSHVLQKDAIPETIKIIEEVTTQLTTTDKPYDSGISTSTVDNYFLKRYTWNPSLANLGRPDIILAKITDISFSYNTSYDTQRGEIDKYGSMSDIESARRLARLVEITRSLLQMTGSPSQDAETLRAIAAQY